MSDDSISKVINNLQKLIDTIENKQLEEYDSFASEFGQTLIENYDDLTQFLTLMIVGQTTIRSGTKVKELFTIPKFFEQLREGIELDDNIETEIKKQGLDLIDQGESLTKDFFALFPNDEEIVNKSNNKIRTNEKNEEEPDKRNHSKEKEGEISTEEILNNIEIISRMNAFYVFSLYAYFDAYCMSLLQIIVAESPKEHVYYIFREIKNISTPEITLNEILSKLRIGDKKLSRILESVMKNNIDWKEHKKVFSTLMKVRHRAAHKKPLLSLEEMENNFPKILTKVSEEQRKLFEEITSIKIELPKTMKETATLLLEPFSEIILVFYSLSELGKSCIRYLLLIDNLIAMYLGHNLEGNIEEKK